MSPTLTAVVMRYMMGELRNSTRAMHSSTATVPMIHLRLDLRAFCSASWAARVFLSVPAALAAARFFLSVDALIVDLFLCDKMNSKRCRRNAEHLL